MLNSAVHVPISAVDVETEGLVLQGMVSYTQTIISEVDVTNTFFLTTLKTSHEGRLVCLPHWGYFCACVPMFLAVEGRPYTNACIAMRLDLATLHL